MRGSSLRFLSILYALEAGIVLLISPWRPIWDRVVPPSSELWWLWTSSFMRAAASGLGALLLVNALQQIVEWRQTRAAG